MMPTEGKLPWAGCQPSNYLPITQLHQPAGLPIKIKESPCWWTLSSSRRNAASPDPCRCARICPTNGTKLLIRVYHLVCSLLWVCSKNIAKFPISWEYFTTWGPKPTDGAELLVAFDDVDLQRLSGGFLCITSGSYTNESLTLLFHQVKQNLDSNG